MNMHVSTVLYLILLHGHMHSVKLLCMRNVVLVTQLQR